MSPRRTLLWALTLATPALACSAPARYQPSTLFPADSSLQRAEDGVALPDGRLVVADQEHGLRLVLPDGSGRPFGDLPGAGYLNTPEHAGAANGVSLEPGGSHVLVADVLGGGIYRVALADGATELVYQHAFGVNAVVRDSRGALWFTQSTANTPDQGEARMFAAVDRVMTDGALLRLDFRHGQFAAQADVLRDGLRYANGLVLDEQNGALYLSEMMADRVLRFDLDLLAGSIGSPNTLIDVPLPDNLELDAHGRLWVTLPLSNQVIVVDTASGRSETVFQHQSTEQASLCAEFVRRGSAGQARMELVTPDQWAPLPGFITGVVLPADGDTHAGPVYISGLGNALIRIGR